MSTIWIGMIEEDQKIMQTFEARLRQVLFEFEELKKKNELLQQTIREKDQAMEHLKEDYHQLQSSYVRLKTAKILSIGDNEAKDTRQRISKLVREVDKCIALLNSK